MQPTLVILAAGMASRYGSLKQIQSFGPSGETIMEYSIYDAIRAGFGKVVFIIRKEFEQDFREIFGEKLQGRVRVDYVFQDLNAFLNGAPVPADRTKPWGTAHAVLCAKTAVNEPFAVINADDFYGRDAFEQAYRFLVRDCNEKTYAIIGYELLKTLSEHGTVNRGVCQVDSKGNLESIAERLNISLKDGQIQCDDNLEPKVLPLKSSVSMNFWCFHPSVFAVSQEMFDAFLKENANNPKSEFFIPIVADKFTKSGLGVIPVIPTSSNWFGVTYKEDAPSVQASLDALVEKGEYPQNLWVS
ncbi:nucleotidyltransferase family protein [Flavihumibacter profundi]|jgi:NDP-sugar pyrophosphorylase family protein|uniref:nucleotidyltransferase family protein n=1 Tax=Flavihumibacter profundi TaxID=2716883 RepID=UPI001CC75D66|nr:sugar phosphate nucleotidyltransferase [Flavihumibacter profundi]MBZ5856527.1 nucleotidyltransferase [Flavihumibacter profundi]